MVAMAVAVCTVSGSPATAAMKDSGVVDASKRVGSPDSRPASCSGRSGVNSSSFHSTPTRSSAPVTVACLPDTRTRF